MHAPQVVGNDRFNVMVAAVKQNIFGDLAAHASYTAPPTYTFFAVVLIAVLQYAPQSAAPNPALSYVCICVCLYVCVCLRFCCTCMRARCELRIR